MSSKLLVNRLIYKKMITMAFFLLFSAIAVSGQEYGYHEVLWVGTSIPAGCPYPNNACRALGWDCYNVAIGASGIVVNEGLLKNDRDGKDLAETIKEKEERYSPYMNKGMMSKILMSNFRSYSYESCVIPYLDGTKAACDIVVFDHGFNDRDVIYNVDQYAIDEYKFDTLANAESYDRSTYLGAFSFLLKKIYEVNPKVKIVICSYLENISEESPNRYYGKNICSFLEKLAEKLKFPYLNMCDYNNFTYEYMPNTSTYIRDYNWKYGECYETFDWGGDNPKGNVTVFQYYCPDGVHPHTDKSRRAEKILTENITMLLKTKVAPYCTEVHYRKQPTVVFDVSGKSYMKESLPNSGVYIMDGKKFLIKQ